ncbi:MAG TPA: serine/threonine-protein kinase [Sandaracinaceae bacterium]
MASVLEQSQAPIPGQVIGGRFRIEREIGVGGMGAVYAAVDLLTGARIALKLMRAELAGDPRAVERFRREGAALAAVSHPAVVQIREVGELEDGSLYLAMELLEGETLAQRLKRQGRMSAEQLLPIVLGLADGLAAAHAGGIIHRDIKPSNIHLPDAAALAHAEATGRLAPVKLVDFGVARMRGFSKVTSSGLAVGTVRYMAPEQLSGGAVDERVDIYALGVVMYEALAGEHPFERTAGEDLIGAVLVGRVTPLSALRPDLPPAVTQVVHRAMARMPTERFASAPDLARAFEHAVRAPHAPLLDEPTGPAWPGPVRHTPVHDPVAFAPTQLAKPRRVEVRSHDPRSAVRPIARRARPPLWLFLPLLVGACLVPGLGIAGFVGFGTWATDLVLTDSSRKVRRAIAEHQMHEFAADLDRLEALHAEDRVNLIAATAFTDRVGRAMREDDYLDRDELVWVMEVVRDIVAHGGAYDLDHFSKMTTRTRGTNSGSRPEDL